MVPDAAASVTQLVRTAREAAGTEGEEATKADEAFAASISTMRLVKSDFEVDQLRAREEAHQPAESKKRCEGHAALACTGKTASRSTPARP